MTKKYDLIIKGGKVVLPDHISEVDIAIKDGLIVGMEQNMDVEGSNVIDAKGLHVLPGVLDSHVHLHPGRGWEGFEYGSKALAAGGVTTYFDMPINGLPPTTTTSALKDKVEVALKESSIDFGLHALLQPDNLSELEGLSDAGAIGFKSFLVAPATPEFNMVDDVTLWRGMKKVAELNKVLSLHSESNPIMEQLTKEQIDAKETTTLRDYEKTRPIVAENESVNRALYFAELTGCAVHFLHITNGAAVDMIQAAKDRGVDVTTETCPHYLLYNVDDYEKIGSLGKCAPPLRSKEENVKMWEALESGKIDVIGSDHAPCSIESKTKNGENILKSFGGVLGGQFLLESMISEGHINRGIELTEIAKWTSTNHAKRFDVYPQKGSLFIGTDADLVLVDLDKERIITKESLLSLNKHSAYIGKKLQCSITHTINRGEIVYNIEEGIDTDIRGKFVRSIND